MELKIVNINVEYNIILGQSHFIKTVEDIYETIVNTNPNAKFGIAFCEASGKSLIRYDGTDDETKKIAIDIAKRLRAGHSFIIVLKNIFPINILTPIKNIPEVVNIFCATQNPVDVVIAENDGKRGILGVIDGATNGEIETEEDIKERHDFLRKIGYKK
ncbi:adenosine-specific kinase [Candidatus Micrarchaeota archaeon]|nr:adenosine-specific kinase [Candidatus Micrarchaeota archaeon]